MFGQQAAVPVSIQMQDGGFAVKGWTPPAVAPKGGWPTVFAVYAGSGNMPALLGEYKVQGGALTFRPRYPLSPGLRIRAVFRGVESFFEIPKVTISSSTRVRQVYPSTNTIPENQL